MSTARRPAPEGPFAEERAFPRVQYPSHLRPYLETGGEVCEVVDCSERGVRYGSALDAPRVGAVVVARIHFRSGVEVRVRGVVVRAVDGEVALSLRAGEAIPPAIIEAEAARLHPG